MEGFASPRSARSCGQGASARRVVGCVVGLALLAGCRSNAAGRTGPHEERAVRAVFEVLNDFHAAAAKADGDRYFASFAPDAVFLGTDPGERWSLEAFRAYALPYFQKGRGWDYQPSERHVFLAHDGRTAWFDERLDNASYGQCRGTGVLRQTGQGWRIVQYNLSLPVPNALAKDLVSRIRAAHPTP